jgi:hypothetical protein
MSLTIFLALCILGLDFMIYFLFKLFFGDRRSLIARRVAAQRKAAQAEAARAEASGLIFIPAEKSAHKPQETDRSALPRGSNPKPNKPFSGSSYTTRIA